MGFGAGYLAGSIATAATALFLLAHAIRFPVSRPRRRGALRLWFSTHFVQGENLMSRIHTNEKAIAEAVFNDDDGNSTTIDGAPVFALVPPEAGTVRDLDPTQPGESANDLPGVDPAFTKVVVPNRDWVAANGGTAGIAAVQLTVSGDGDRSDGVRPIVATAALEFALPEATAAVLTVRDPIHQ